MIALLEDQEFRYHIFRPGLFQIGPKIMGPRREHGFAVFMFLLLAASQFYFARKKME